MRHRDSIFLAFSLLFLGAVLAGSTWLNQHRYREILLVNEGLAGTGEKAVRPIQAAMLSPQTILQAAQPWLSKPEFNHAHIQVCYVHLAAVPPWHDPRVDGRDLYDVVAIGTDFSPFNLPSNFRTTYHEIHRVDLFYDPKTAALHEVRFHPSALAWP